MVLIDTSIWIHHFRKRNPELSRLLADGQIAMHSFVIGELRCGNLPMREQTLVDFGRLPSAPHALDREVYDLIENQKLMGLGIGFVDAHLLASALLGALPLWTHDRRLREVAESLRCAYAP